jgi:hypothetical protein
MAKNKNKARASGGSSPKKRRVPIPPEVRDEVLRKSLRRCCICFVLKKVIDPVEGQIAHLDQNNANPQPDNLAYLCLDCHNKYDQKSNRTLGYSPREIKRYRDDLHSYVCCNPMEWHIYAAAPPEKHEELNPVVEAALTILRTSFPDVRLTVGNGKRRRIGR